MLCETSVDNSTFNIFGFALRAYSDTINICQSLNSRKTYFHYGGLLKSLISHKRPGIGCFYLHLHNKRKNLFHMISVLQNYI